MSSADKTRLSKLAVVVAIVIAAVILADRLLSLLNLLLIYVVPLIVLGVIAYFLFFGGSDQRNCLSPKEKKATTLASGFGCTNSIMAFIGTPPHLAMPLQP